MNQSRTNISTDPEQVGDPQARGWTAYVRPVLFWCVVLVFYTFYFGRHSDTYLPGFLIVCLLLPITVGTALVFTRFLIPRYLLTRRYVRFGLYCLYALIGSLYLELLIVVLTFIFVADFQLAALDPSTLDLFDLLVGMYVVVLVVVAWNLQQRWFDVKSREKTLENERLEAQLKLKEIQLKLLRAQIHPHFLFNTLNNLYGLTLAGSEKAPDVVLRLSEMLDYMLYKGDREFVPLEEEVGCIRNYLTLESLRYGEKVKVDFTETGPVSDARIAPLLLIPLVENSFKHGVRPAVRDAWVRIDLSVVPSGLELSVRNSRPGDSPAPGPAPSSGIGLQNLKKRLELLYPDRHTLRFQDSPREFRTDLTVTFSSPI